MRSLEEFDAVEKAFEDLWLNQDRSGSTSRHHNNRAILELTDITCEIGSKLRHRCALEHQLPPQISTGKRLPSKCTYQCTVFSTHFCTYSTAENPEVKTQRLDIIDPS